jgi:hypothetical protein
MYSKLMKSKGRKFENSVHTPATIKDTLFCIFISNPIVRKIIFFPEKKFFFQKKIFFSYKRVRDNSRPTTLFYFDVLYPKKRRVFYLQLLRSTILYSSTIIRDFWNGNTIPLDNSLR